MNIQTGDIEERISAETLVLDIAGFEGPLDLLLVLARGQKVDLMKVSILELSEAYLSFIETVRRLRIELAADYLVMAAWLAFLKSRLLLPPDPEEEGPSADELADHLAFQLQRLEGMRDAAARLMGRDLLGRDVFARGEELDERPITRTIWTANIMDLMQAYARTRTRDDFTPLHYERRNIFTMEQALERMRGLIGARESWTELSAFLPEGWATPKERRSAVAASFAAALELVKSGRADIQQADTYAPLMLRAAQ
ncbi:segregation and condensation protein A [Paracoccaceae bacterium GXU_MW_L88]